MRKQKLELILIMIAIFSLAAPHATGISGSNHGGAHKAGEQSGHCLRPVHDHTYSDLRIAAIEVEDVDECGFEFANLGDNTVGAGGTGHRLYYADDFYVVRISGEHVKRSDFHAMKRGIRGTIIYCSETQCQRVFAMQVVPPSQTGFVPAEPGR